MTAAGIELKTRNLSFALLRKPSSEQLPPAARKTVIQTFACSLLKALLENSDLNNFH